VSVAKASEIAGPERASFHLVLPRAGALTDVITASPGEPPSDDELSAARETVSRGTRKALAGAPPGSTLRVDSYRIQLAFTQDRGLSFADDTFAPSPATCRRAIGSLAVARSVRERSIAPGKAVAEILDRAAGASVEACAWWEEWYRRIPSGARAVVRSEAVTWATQLYEAIEWDRLERPPVIGGDFRWRTSDAARASLHGKVDVHASVDGRPVLFVMPTGVPGPNWSAALGLSALVSGLARGPRGIPARVVGLWPASGQVRILSVGPGEIHKASGLAVEAAFRLARMIHQGRHRASVGTL
jgi:hypothetical protein